MDTISGLLQPYKTIIGNIAVAVTFMQFLSGGVVCNDIRKKSTTIGFSIIPFLGGLVFCIIGFKFGFILNDDATIKINLLGFALNVIYLTVFYYYTPGKNKTQVWAQLGYGGALAFGILAYAQYEDPKLIEFRYGIIMTVFLFALVASPFLSLGEIIRKKSTEGLPFPIIASGTLVSILWLLYGFCLNNFVMVIQNVVVLVLSAIQLSLFVIYPSSGAGSEAGSGKSKKQKKNASKKKTQ